MRFDDSLETILAAEMSSPFGAQSTWRQLVDLVGRRRIPAGASVTRLKAIRARVPVPVRAASARALAFTDPPAALVALFATDEPAVAAPVLTIARLRPDQWAEILPSMSPATRSVLRNRRDLHPDVRRALGAFGLSDFILPSRIDEDEERPALSFATEAEANGNGRQIAAKPFMLVPAPDASGPPAVAVIEPDDHSAVPISIDWTAVLRLDAEPQTLIGLFSETGDGRSAGEGLVPASERSGAAVSMPSAEGPAPLLGETPFVSLASVVRGLPVVVSALSLADEPAAPSATVDSIAGIPPGEEVDANPNAAGKGLGQPESGEIDQNIPVGSVGAQQVGSSGFEIAELVARIDAYKREREDGQVRVDTLPKAAPTGFRFATDEAGVIRWVSGIERGPLVGLSLGLTPNFGAARVDGAASGAFRRRTKINDARLVVEGNSDAAGQWRISAGPVFDVQSGRFTGYHGVARRPRCDEGVEPRLTARSPEADALRQLVHELRTPTNAIAGFAEMIEREMLGPVSSLYRERARQIRTQVSDLIGAIDDIDLAARLESHALQLRPGAVAVNVLLLRVIADLEPLLSLRGAAMIEVPATSDPVISGDERTIDRLVSRLLATVAGAASRGERLSVTASHELPDVVSIVVDRPATLADQTDDELFAADAEVESGQGIPLLGTGFALRLVRNLAAEIGGALTIGEDRLTLRLPAAFSSTVGQASSN